MAAFGVEAFLFTNLASTLHLPVPARTCAARPAVVVLAEQEGAHRNLRPCSVPKVAPSSHSERDPEFTSICELSRSSPRLESSAENDLFEKLQKQNPRKLSRAATRNASPSPHRCAWVPRSRPSGAGTPGAARRCRGTRTAPGRVAGLPEDVGAMSLSRTSSAQRRAPQVLRPAKDS